jgi:MoaA/NifB/PqqE/SkfB family radical SAM enzyme
MSYKAARLAQLSAVKERPGLPGPAFVIWQITNACDLCCAPCRSELANRPSRDELSLEEGLDLIEHLRRTGQPELTLTGGDPLKRPDLGVLVLYAHRLGLPVGLTLSGTPRTTPRQVGLLKAAGLQHITFCLDGPVAEAHDLFRQVPGSFNWTLQGIRVAQAIGLSIQIESVVCPATIAALDDMAAMVRRLGAKLWQVTFGARPGRDPGGAFPVEEHAQAVERLAALQGTADLRIRIIAAPYFEGRRDLGGCTAPWRPPALFVSDSGLVEKYNTGRVLGSIRRDGLEEIMRRALQPEDEVVASSTVSGG